RSKWARDCAAARDVPVVVFSISRSVLSAGDVAVDRDNNLLLTAGYSIYRLPSSGADAQVIAGSSTLSGPNDGVGGAARFNRLFGITCDTSNNIAYIGDYGNSRIRTLDLKNNNVTTLAGSSYGYQDGIGVVTLAGGTAFGFADGIGTNVQFNEVLGAVLNGDETAMIVADYHNNLVRRVELSTKNVSSIAGAPGAAGLVDGPGLAARFYGPNGGKWYCNTTLLLCGLLMADYSNGAIRFVALETMPTRTLELSSEATSSSTSSGSKSSTMPLSRSSSTSQSATCTFSKSMTKTLSLSDSKNIDSISASLSVSGSQSPGKSQTLSVSFRSSSNQLTVTPPHQATQSLLTAATFTNGLSVSTLASLSRSHSVKVSTRSCSEVITNTSSVSNSDAVSTSEGTLSVTLSHSKATRTASKTKRTLSPSATMCCALVPAQF
ncbi:unnamed protein product, partial [Bodo saltans]